MSNECFGKLDESKPRSRVSPAALTRARLKPTRDSDNKLGKREMILDTDWTNAGVVKIFIKSNVGRNSI